MRSSPEVPPALSAFHLFSFATLGLVGGCSPPPPDGGAPSGGVATEQPAQQLAGEWAQRALLPERRTEVSVATDGRYLYLMGGFGTPQGQQRATAPRTLWRYDPQANEWTAIGEIPRGVHHAPFQYHDGRLYILGGFGETSFDPVPNVWIHDLASGEWSEGAPMPTPRGASGWALVDGKIHVFGGNAASAEAIHDHAGAAITADRSVNVHEAYDPAVNSWTRLEPMPTPRNHLGAAALGGRIHVILGRADGDFTLTTHEIYDVVNGTWNSGPPVPTGRSGVAVLEHGGYVYAFGGEVMGETAHRTFDDAERFDPRANRWERLPPMPTPRHGLGAAAIGDSIYVVSGGPEPGFTFGDANERLVVGR